VSAVPREYGLLVERARETGYVGSAQALLAWDEETGMPPRGLEYRAGQLAFLAGWVHERFTAAEVGEWIARCEAQEWAADSVEAANVREWRRAYDRETKLPRRLVEETKAAQSHGQHAWAAARASSDFAAFAPHLETLLALRREAAECWGYAAEPYDALLETYEPGLTSASADMLLGTWQRELVPVLERARSRPRPAGIAADYPADQQRAFNATVARAMGFNLEAGRIDTAPHPFCSRIHPGDVRLTTRYDTGDFTSSLYGVLHEAGHGMYEQGLAVDAFGQPAGEVLSLAMHESQSRLWENHVGRSAAFWEHWYPEACRVMPALRAFSVDQVLAHVTRVEPGCIRVEADEVTYDLHVVLRFRLERAMVAGDLAVADIPAAWNEGMRALLGVEVPDDARGCLQDIHWSMGAFGYFPTYTLGNLNAAQLMAAARRDLPGLDASLATGTANGLLGWLRDRVHRWGGRLRAAEIMRRATGSDTGTEACRAHLLARYG
jgi:carboxypeptidase Taq